MKYMLLLRHEPGTGPAEGTAEFDAEMAQWGQVMGELGAAGAMVAANGLDTEATAKELATSVLIRWFDDEHGVEYDPSNPTWVH